MLSVVTALLLPMTAFSAPPTKAPAGFSITKTTETCTLMLGPVVQGFKTMRAECHLPNVDPKKVDVWMSDWSAHVKPFSAVVESTVLKTEGGVATVRQVHQASGISNRQVLLHMTKTVQGGETTYGWKMAPSQEPAKEGHVIPTHDVGYWKISAHPDGGTKALHQIEYAPGGSVPGFLVRAFQTSGLESTASEFTAYARSH